MAHVIDQEQEQEEPPRIRTNPSFYYKGDGIVFVRDPHNLQKKLEADECPHKIRFDTCMLKPSFNDEKSRHICYAQLPLNIKILGVRAQMNHARNQFHICMDYVYTKTTKSWEEMEPQSVRTFYLFQNQLTYSEQDIPYNDSYLTELKDDEYEISLMKYIGTVMIPEAYMLSQPYRETIVHVFARDYSKVMGLPVL